MVQGVPSMLLASLRSLCPLLRRAASLTLIAILSGHVLAQDKPKAPIQVAELKFDGSRTARMEGRLVGPATHEYTFDARKGQKVELILSSDRSPWIGIDLLAPVFAATLKKPPTVYTNFIDGSTRWEGIAPGNGRYTVRLALMNSQARRAGRVDYELDVKLK
jgi:hypothetical protein